MAWLDHHKSIPELADMPHYLSVATYRKGVRLARHDGALRWVTFWRTMRVFVFLAPFATIVVLRMIGIEFPMDYWPVLLGVWISVYIIALAASAAASSAERRIIRRYIRQYLTAGI